MKKVIQVISFVLIFSLAFSTVVFAHSGRTDSQGGHHDYKNVSGLGDYHYHCGGNPPHLHPNGVCPYSSSGTDNSGSSDTPVIKLNKKSVVLAIGVKLTLKVSGTNSTVKWSTDKKKIATIKKSGTKKGIITAKKVGKATITAKVNGKKVKCKVKVTNPSLSATVLKVPLDSYDSLEIKGTSSDADWTSSNEEVATVYDGEIYPEGVGSTTITAKVDGKKLKCKVIIYENPETGADTEL